MTKDLSDSHNHFRSSQFHSSWNWEWKAKVLAKVATGVESATGMTSSRRWGAFSWDSANTRKNHDDNQYMTQLHMTHTVRTTRLMHISFVQSWSRSVSNLSFEHPLTTLIRALLFQFSDYLNPTFKSFGLSWAVKVWVVQSVPAWLW